MTVRGSGGGHGGGGAPVTVFDPAAHAQAVAALRADIAADRPADAAGFQARWTPTTSRLPYDPLQAQGSTASPRRVSASAMPSARRSRATDSSISARQTFPTFFYGYKAIYADHLPLYVSVDSVMHAVHRSYDTSLMRIESASLIPS